MIMNIRPRTWEEIKEEMKSYRPKFIKEVTKGKKTTWEECNFWERNRIDYKCKMYYEDRNRYRYY